MPFARIILFLFAIVFIGCIKENDCTPDEDYISISFDYNGDGTSDIFKDHITKVDLFVFDKNGYFVTNLTADRNSLKNYQGIRIKLPEDTYRFVCWANAYDNTITPTLTTSETIDDAFVICGINKDGAIREADSLYFGSTQAVPQKKRSNDEYKIDFRSSHILIKVYIKGFSDTSQPIVELDNIVPNYDFSMKPFGEFVNYKKTSEKSRINSEMMGVASFYVPRMGNENPVIIKIIKASTQVIETELVLKDFIRENHIDITKLNDFTLPIMFEFKSTGVEVTLPKWGNDIITPN